MRARHSRMTHQGAQNAQKTVNYKMYKCPSCGAEILTDENTVATFCSFCQSPTLIEDKLTGAIAPSRIIAFKNNKEMPKVHICNGLNQDISFLKNFQNPV